MVKEAQTRVDGSGAENKDAPRFVALLRNYGWQIWDNENDCYVGPEFSKGADADDHAKTWNIAATYLALP